MPNPVMFGPTEVVGAEVEGVTHSPVVVEAGSAELWEKTATATAHAGRASFEGRTPVALRTADDAVLSTLFETAVARSDGGLGRATDHVRVFRIDAIHLSLSLAKTRSTTRETAILGIPTVTVRRVLRPESAPEPIPEIARTAATANLEEP